MNKEFDLEKFIDHAFYWLGKAFYWTVVFISPVYGMLFFILCLVITDYFSGVMAAKKRGEMITSRGFRRTVIKYLQYGNLILLGFLADRVFINDVLQRHGSDHEWLFSIVLTAVVARIEFKSISENYTQITGKDVWKGVTHFYTEFIKTILKHGPKKK